MAERIRHRKSRNPSTSNINLNQESDPNSIRSKPTISCIPLSSSGLNSDGDGVSDKKKNFTTAAFRGLGCTAPAQVLVPAAIRKSADWEVKKVKKKRLRTKKSSNDKVHINNNSAAAASAAVACSTNPSSVSLAWSSSCVGVPDVWCGPEIGLTTDAASVDCVVLKRHARGKVDGMDKIVLGQRERSNTARRMVIPEDSPFMELETPLVIPHFRPDVSGCRQHRHVRHGFDNRLAEIVMLQSSLLMGGSCRSDGLDRYRDLRLDVDNMSYEELLELGDRIGYVSTGLRDDDITCCLRRTKPAILDDLSLRFASQMERKCSICQEEYERDDETGKLNCGHFYHIECIKQWLWQKNTCPICKTAALSRT